MAGLDVKMLVTCMKMIKFAAKWEKIMVMEGTDDQTRDAAFHSFIT